MVAVWQQCRTKFRPFDKVRTNLTCSVCFDFVERTKFHENSFGSVAKKATKSKVASALLLKRQQYRSDVRLYRINIRLCSIVVDGFNVP